MCPHSTVIAVDPWVESSNSPVRVDWKKQLSLHYSTFCVNVWEERDRITPVRLPALKALLLFQDLNIYADVVYIDGLRDYDNVRTNCNLAIDTFPDSLLCGLSFQDVEVTQAILDVANARGREVRYKDQLWWHVQA